MAKQSVEELYTGRSSFYDRLFVDFLGWRQELTRFFAKSDPLHPHARILDAGCGTGVITRVLYQHAQERGIHGVQFHAFDLTESMLAVFRRWIAEHGAEGIELRQADVLDPEALPSHWKDYDWVVSSTMIEYIPGDKVEAALDHLKQRLKPEGRLLLLITRRTALTRWLAEKWWKTSVYREADIHSMLGNVGFGGITSRQLSPGWSGSIMAVEAHL